MTDPIVARYPYPSRRTEVHADRVVATSQPLAAQAGLEMLRRGGTAVDAAVATAAALTVVEPVSNGLGADAFALVWDGQRVHGLNASGRAPTGLDQERFLSLEGMPLRGWDTVTVPGAVSAWVALSERFGRLGLPTLLAPATAYADEGWAVGPVTAAAWEQAVADEALASQPGFAETFLRGGRAPRVGERVHFADHARSLRAIADSNGHAFYQGELAERLVRAAADAGAPHRGEDLATHEVEWVTPLRHAHAGREVWELPPNGQGIAALWQLAILERTRGETRAGHDPDGLDEIHAQIEAAKIALGEAERIIADPARRDRPPEAGTLEAAALLDATRLDDLAEGFDPTQAGDFGYQGPARGGTVLLAAADGEGRLCVLIQSNYRGFGSGVVVPGTGIALQNRGACFSTTTGHPNVIAPGARPFHTIIPAMLAEQDRPTVGFGVMGGHLQAQGHAQLVRRVLVGGQSPQAAIDAPRWRVDGRRRVALEHGLAPVAEGLSARGHDVALEPAGASISSAGFGGAQWIGRTASGWMAASDPRKEGMAIGY